MLNHASRRLAASFLLAALGFCGCTSKTTKDLLAPGQALGVVAAEEAAKLAGAKKSVVVITHDVSWGPASSTEVAFMDALKKRGISVAATVSANLGDPMKSGEIGLKSAEFFNAIEKSAGAGAMVSLAGAPHLAPGDVSRLGSEHAPLVVVATASTGDSPGVAADWRMLALLMDQKVVTVAIVDGNDQAGSGGKEDSTHEMFHQHFKVLRQAGK